MRYFIILLIWIFASPVMAQKGESVILNVVYEFTHINDLNNPDKALTEDMLLALGKTESRYTRNFKKQLPKNSSGGGIKKVAAIGGPVAVVSSKPSTTTELFQYVAAKKIVTTSKLGMQSYLMEDGLPQIKWKIYQENKTIGNYLCQKAIGEYAGRIYTVWFALELPFHNGPWKLSGLPGLILEAKDSKNEVLFLFKELYKGNEEESTGTTYNVTKFVKTSSLAFAKLEKAYIQDPAAAFQSQLPANGPKVVTVFIDDNGKSTSGEEAKTLIEKYKKEAKYKKDNPIELIKDR
jgi:GLPGLI family protein